MSVPTRPYRHRFNNAVRNDGRCVFALKPFSDDPWLDHLGRRAGWSCRALTANCPTPDDIEWLDELDCNLGMLCGAVSGVTVLSVTTRKAQEWLDAQEMPSAPSSWSRPARNYFYAYADPATYAGLRLPDGIRLLGDGDYITYPGSIYADGRVAYWEDGYYMFDDFPELPLEALELASHEL